MVLAGALLAAGCPGDDDDPDPGPEPELLPDVVGEHVALPYAEVGDPVPTATLVVSSPEGGELEVVVEGPFLFDGPDSVDPGGEVSLTVTLDHPTDQPELCVGLLSLAIDGRGHPVSLAAVVGRAGLAEAEWSTDSWATHTVIKLPSAPFPEGSGGPWEDGSVLIAVPDGLAPRGSLHVVTHLHGHNALLEDTVAAQRLVEQHALSGRDAVLIAPQGPLQEASGDFGPLMDPGGHAALVLDVHAVLYRDGLIQDARRGSQVLTAHSGGYLATAAILGDGGIDTVHLFDALYGEVSAFEGFALDGGVLRSAYTAGGGTDGQNQLLADSLTGDGVAVGTGLDDAALAAFDVTIGPSWSSHGGVISDTRAFARWSVVSGLPPHALAPPELMAVTTEAVIWRVDRGAVGRTVVVEGSDDGTTWTDLGRSATGALELAQPSAWVRVRGEAPAARPSDCYGTSGGAWLVVDGFDRVFGGSWTEPTHDFAARVGTALPSYDSASSEALVQGLIDATAYDGVIWLLGDESVADQTFDALEMAVVSGLVAAATPVILSGAELGYASDASWLAGLGVGYASDDAGTDQAGGYTFGVTYPEDYPDVLTGDEVIWTYDTGGAAAVRSGGVIAVGFPLETLADEDLEPALAELVAVLGP